MTICARREIRPIDRLTPVISELVAPMDRNGSFELDHERLVLFEIEPALSVVEPAEPDVAQRSRQFQGNRIFKPRFISPRRSSLPRRRAGAIPGKRVRGEDRSREHRQTRRRVWHPHRCRCKAHLSADAARNAVEVLVEVERRHVRLAVAVVAPALHAAVVERAGVIEPRADGNRGGSCKQPPF